MRIGKMLKAAVPPIDPEAPGKKARRLLLGCCATHLVTDGLISAVYPLLPLIALDLQLSYTAVGSIRTALTASSSAFQIPVGFLADRIAETTLLNVGMLWLSVGFAAMALAAGFWSLMVIISVAGIGGNAQHPLATAIVSKAYESKGRGAAVSSLNFAGDLGKVLLPALAGVLAVAYGWRGAVLALGAIGVAASLVYALVVGKTESRAPVERVSKDKEEKIRGWGIQKPISFAILSAIGIIDNSTRVAVLTFMPFLMANKGLDAAAISFLLTLIFACGAAGKLGCGFLADRFGNVGVILITEAVTAVSTLAVIPVDSVMLIPILVAFGFVLNGTSSALYSAVAEMVHVERRARGYGLFYTLCLGCGTLAPILYGAVADSVGVSGAFVAIAAVNLSTLPMAFFMGRRDRKQDT